MNKPKINSLTSVAVFFLNSQFLFKIESIIYFAKLENVFSRFKNTFLEYESIWSFERFISCCYTYSGRAQNLLES